MPMWMTYWPVSLPLKGLIDDIYVFRAAGPSFRGLTGALLPQAHWVLKGEMNWQAGAGPVQPVPPSGALGPSGVALTMESLGETIVVGFGLYPEGWSALMPITAGSVRERVFDLRSVWEDRVGDLLALDPAQSDEILAAAVDRFLLERLPQAAPIDPRVVAISEWADREEHDLQQLARELSISLRQVQRLAMAAHGLPPRLLANKHKILRMAAVLALGEHDNRRETWTTEYFDQAHFIYHFKRFIGVNPTKFMKNSDLLVRQVLTARFGIGSRHPLGLASSSAIIRAN